MNVINDPQNVLPIDLKSLERNMETFEVVYDEGEDILFARPGKPHAATSFDWEGEIWVRVNPETGEVVGLEVDDFESVFLKKHPDLAKAWQEVKPVCHRKRTARSKCQDESWESFLRIIYAFFREFFRSNPTQLSAFGVV